MILYEKYHSESAEYFHKYIGQNMSFMPHLHNSFELIYVQEGEIYTTVNQTEVRLTEGEAAFILPNQIHSYRTELGNTFLLFIFSADLVGSFHISGKEGKSFVFRPSGGNNNTFICSLLKCPQEDLLMLKSSLYGICAEFCQQVELVPRKEADFDLLHKVLQYVQERFTENISLQEAARQYGYDYHYLSRYFNDNTGVHFREFVNHYRVHFAQYLLGNTSRTITNIADSCGFESLRNFNRAFKKFTGVTPSEYKAQLK